MKEPAEPDAGDGQTGEGTPQLTLAGFHGSLDALLAQARAHRIDLATLPIKDFVSQQADRLQQASARTPLSRKADWLVMASWILLLRSNLLLPADAPTQRAALAQAGQLRDRLVTLQEIQAVAAWLERRPHLGRDVFARGQPDHSRALGIAQPGAAAPHVDVVAFLWACLEQFDDQAGAADERPIYRPKVLSPHPWRMPARASSAGLPKPRRGRRLTSSCQRPTIQRLRMPAKSRAKGRQICGGAPPGPAPLSPAWNWQSRAMLPWVRTRSSVPSMSAKLGLRCRLVLRAPPARC